MEEYLQSTKAALASGTLAKVHAVLGNEACDLDSAVSALTYAYYLHKTQSSADTLHIPVFNIPRADYPLRTEVTFYLKQFKVTPAQLTFRDDLDLGGLHKDSKLTLTLVDHNVLGQADSGLDGAVAEVIDHHRRDRPENDKESVTLELVGSCCTLVAEKLTNDDSFILDHQMADMLYGPIVLDTINLSDDAGIKTPKDVLMLDKLQPLRPEGATAQSLVYTELDTAKADVSSLTTMDLLRKDMKALSSPDVKVVFCSVPVQLETFLTRADITSSLSTFAITQGAAVVILMSLTVLETKPQRQIAVYSQDDKLRQQAQDLLKSADPALDLSPVTSPSDTISAYHQGNAKASRKKVLPHLKANLNLFSHHQVETAVSSPSEDSGVALLDLSPEVTDPETPADVQDPFGLGDLSGVATEVSITDKQASNTPSAQVDDLLGLDLSTPALDTSVPAIIPGLLTGESTAEPKDSQKDNILESAGLLDLNDTQINANVPGTVAGVTTSESSTDPVSDQKEDLPETGGLLDLSDTSINTTLPAIITGVTTNESSTDPQSAKKEEANESIGLLDLGDTPVNTTDPAIVTGVTTSESTTDPEGDQKDSSYDDIPESIKPGGLLDDGFFAPKEESDSDNGSVGSLDDYERDDEPKEVPTRSEQEVLDLLSDALQEEQRASSVSPDRPTSATEAPKLEPDVEKDSPKPQVDLLDPFEHHEGVLIEASPLEGMTPDPSATPDTSQPTSPPSVSYPGTPPNSYMDSNIMDTTRGQQDLPSFMNADMVRRIHEKKAGLSVTTDHSDQPSRDDHFPFTPQNSVSDSSLDHLMRHQTLPSFDNAEMVEAVHNKRADQYGAESPASSEALKFPYAPPNSFVDSSLGQMQKKGGPLELVEQDFADRMNKKQLPIHEEEASSPLDEVEKMDLPTKTTGNVVAMRIAEEMKVQTEDKEIRELVNDHSGNVVANRIAQEIKAGEEHKEISGIVNNHSGNVVAFRIAQEMKEKEKIEDASPAEPSVWDGKMLSYTGEDEVDVANQFAADVILRALEDIRTTGESLQAELAKADGVKLEEDEDGADVSNNGAEDILNKNTSDSAVLPELPLPHVENEQGLTSQSSKDDSSNLQSALRKAHAPDGAKKEGGESTVTFAEEPKLTLISPDFEGRPHSDSQVSEASSGGDSDLSWTTRDFVSRMRSDTGASVISGNSDDLLVAATQMDVAQNLVDEAMSAAVDIVKQDDQEKPQEKLTEAGEWDAETLKTRMDQLPEHQPVVAMDTTATSTSKEADDEADRMSPQRPMSLESTPKKRIVPNMELLQDVHDDSGVAHASVSSSEGEPLDSFNDLHTPDDLNTPEALGDSIFEGELDWEDKREKPVKKVKGDEGSEDTPVDPIPEYSAREEFEDEKNWRSVTVGDRQFRIDMKVIEPYKKVLSHGGYYGDGFNAILIFAGCYLPDKRRRDYHYVMDNLFLYVLSTLELLVVEDYMVVYFHGATPKQRMPSLRWLKRCYEMIDRRLRKNLKSLLIVHPTLWIKTIMTLTKPFISSKFSSKLKYVRGLKELADVVPMEYIFVPDEIKMFDDAKFRHTQQPAAT